MELNTVKPKVLAVDPGPVTGYAALTDNGEVITVGETADAEHVLRLIDEFTPEEVAVRVYEAPEHSWAYTREICRHSNHIAWIVSEFAVASGLRATSLQESELRSRWDEIDAGYRRVLERSNLPRQGQMHAKSAIRCGVARLLDSGAPVV